MRKKQMIRDKQMPGSILKEKKGAAILIAVVVMMIAVVLSLSLLLVSYSLYSTVNKQHNMDQCKELAQSVSREIEREITGSDVEFDSFDSMKKAVMSGEYPLWSYLRFHVWQTGWPYYNKEERGHSKTYACRTFKVKFDETEDTEILDTLSVKMYWESEEEAQKGEGTTLVTEVSCKKGKQESMITSVYNLSIEENIPGYTGKERVLIPGPYNKENYKIRENEKWTFSLSERY
ncbi:MAG: hypothetical protein PUH29_04160 [Lachnospiraceae bacterium]|nr:hypothetical protein [Lachnospiraceae bacterium]MDY5496706.1 hypothetical protein [Anaerobutyricum sp.]